MRFQVPQFIDVEDKIVGPLTLKQFLYIGGAAGVSFILFFALQTWLWAIITVLMGSVAAGLAFARYNGQSLPKILVAAVRYLWEPKFYLWRRAAVQGHTPKLAGVKGEPAPSIKGLWLKMTTSSQPIGQREKPFTPFAMFNKSNELLDRFEKYKKQTGDTAAARRVDYR